jgi:hypothetical protein
MVAEENERGKSSIFYIIMGFSTLLSTNNSREDYVC